MALVETPTTALPRRGPQADGRRHRRGPQPLGRHRHARACRTASPRSARRPRSAAAAAARRHAAAKPRPGRHAAPSRSPTASGTWRMIGATSDGAHRRATGQRRRPSASSTPASTPATPTSPRTSTPRCRRNFTMDIPAIDGPCEVPTCIDPADVDDGGHGTHVAGIVAAARNGIGIAGVAPDATIVNLRAGQDSGYFFLYETVAALTYAGDAGLDVVNMSFYTDPWLYNCDSADDYISGAVTAEELAEQAIIQQTGHSPRSSTPTTTASRWSPRPATGTPTWPLPDAVRRHQPRLPAGHRGRAGRHQRLPRPAQRGPARDRRCPRSGRRRPSPTSRTTASAASTSRRRAAGSATSSAPRSSRRRATWSCRRTRCTSPSRRVSPTRTACRLDDFCRASAATTTARTAASTPTCRAPRWRRRTWPAWPPSSIEAHGQGSRGHGYSLDPDAVRADHRAHGDRHACPAGGVEVYTDEGRARRLQRVLRRHDGRQRPLRRGHRQRRRRGVGPRPLTTQRRAA